MSESDDSDNIPAESVDNDDENIGTQIVKAVVGGVINAPAWAQKAVLKVAERLVLPYTDIPKAWAEGIAGQVRARNEARATITLEATKLLVNNPQENPVAARAMAREASKIFREQVNLEDIVSIAAKKVEKEASGNSPPNEVSDDWLNSFEREASTKSSEEMKEVFGRILAGEILNPGAFSIRAVRLISSLSTRDATSLRNLFGLATFVGFGYLDVNVGVAAGQNGLKDYGLSYGNLTELVALGVISSDLNSEWRVPKVDQGRAVHFAIKYGGNDFVLIKRFDPEKDTAELKLQGVLLTALGAELAKIVEPFYHENYTTALRNTLTELSCELVPLVSTKN